MPKSESTDDAAIREQAYYFWEQDGRPGGRETEYWQRASVAVAEKSQMDTLIRPAPKQKANTEALGLKRAASKSKAATVKTEAAKKPKKK